MYNIGVVKGLQGKSLGYLIFTAFSGGADLFSQILFGIFGLKAKLSFCSTGFNCLFA